ncbi:metal ABC transporter ATP-binding protein [Terasakiella sp. A23]|uniref:metal ABC transporter ATP-binding protein n=1 Tax=Terasakiella sp. FCG-A23 TaxID=3080561 RepID=UPI0029546B67|nr:metal ABC transporter ATP-binding protein [Terasakiella sp. A23]MDV7340501.1 metal ABC transporter ATP-binding protein [Terasakiella sp. A23]
MTDFDKPLISLKSAGVYENERWLIRDVDLVVHPGEIVSLIGPNGSGKSTTLKAAIGLMKLREGEAYKRPGLRIGYVPQKLSIDATLPMTVRRLMKLSAHYNDDVIEDMLHSVGMLEHANSPVHALSGGEFQRVLLARAMIGQPDLLLLDEPVQGVDYTGEALLYDLISSFRDKTNCGVLLISHDLHVVMAQTDRVLCLNGHVCCTGTPQTVANNPKYQELFGEHAANSFALYQHKHDHTHLDDGRVMHADGSITDHCHHEDGHHDHEKGDRHAG